MDLLATHLTPLLAAGDASGRLPNPLTLNNLNDAPVITPRSADEERIDLNGARQMVLLAVEATDGTDALAGYFLRIKNRFALSEVVYQTSGEITRVKLRATQEQLVDINSPLKGTTPGLSLASHLNYTSGTAAGDTVGTGMVADPVGQDKIGAGSTPRQSALAGVMGKLVTNPRRPNASRYIKGHLLNHHIGGPGDNSNMYPITAAANSAHLHNIETDVKNWVETHRYWVYYRVQVRNIHESITKPDSRKDPENFINATFHCNAYIKNADGTKRDEKTYDAVSAYTQYTTPVPESVSDPVPEGES